MEVRHSEALYLVSQLLKDLGDFEQTAAAFQLELERNSSLGKSYSWNGECRYATLADFDRKFSNLPGDQLIQLLRLSIDSLIHNKKEPASSSLLQRIGGIYNANDQVQRMAFEAQAKKLSLSVRNLGCLNAERRLLEIKLASLRAKASFLREHECFESSETSTCSPCAVEACSRAVIVLDPSDDIMNTLRTLGLQKAVEYFCNDIFRVKAQEESLLNEMKALVEDIGKMGCLSHGLTRGSIDCGLDWLNARSYGLAKAPLGGCGLLVNGIRAFLPSSARSRRKFTTSYRLMWTVSGHMLNPAYCTLIDPSGRYAITGADDYLVKVWDIDKGALQLTCKGHMSPITLVCISPDNSVMASACMQGIIRIWRMCDGLCLKVLRHGNEQVNWIAFDKTSCAFASVGDDGQCIVWDLSRLLPVDSGDFPLLQLLISSRGVTEPLMPSVARNHCKPLPSEAMEAVGEAAVDVTTIEDKSEIQISQHVTPSRATPTSSDGGQIAAAASTIRCLSVDAAVSTTPVTTSAVTTTSSSGTATTAGGTAVNSTTSSEQLGFFEWSRGNRNNDNYKLVLPHLQEDSQRAEFGRSKSIKIKCLDMSPNGGVLATGCEDGIVRLWRFHDIATSLNSSGWSNGTRSASSVQALRGLLSPHELARIEAVAQHMLPRLEGHVSSVTDVRFSNVGDRIVSGSMNDGTARIWALSSDFTKSEQILLRVADDDDEFSSNGVFAAMKGARGRGNRRKPRTNLYNVCWSADDTRIITLQSVPSSLQDSVAVAPTRLKVWCSMTGDLLRVIGTASLVEASVLYPHPLDPTIVLTGGDDGIVKIWDIDQEELVSSHFFENTVKQGPVVIVDACFSPDGSRISVTDELGRLSILALDDPDRYQHIREGYAEQYFSTDYSDIILDNEGYAIDVSTQLPVHQAPRGPLCRQNLSAYDDELKNSHKGPSPIPAATIKMLLDGHRLKQRDLGKLMNRILASFVRNHERPARRYTGSMGDPGKGRSPGMPSARDMRGRVHTLSDLPTHSRSSPFAASTQGIWVDEDDRDEDWAPTTRNVFASRGRRLDEEEAHAISVLERNQRAAHREQQRRSLYASSDEDSDDAASSSNSSDDSDFDDDDDDGLVESDDEDGRVVRHDDGEVRRRPRKSKKSRRGRPLRRTSRLVVSEESVDGDDQLSEYVSSDANRDNGGSGSPNSELNERLAPRARRSRREHSTRTKRPRTPMRYRDEGHQRRTFSPAAAANSNAVANDKRQVRMGRKMLPLGVEVDRSWLQMDEQKVNQYCPQLGDIVVYFPQGHADLLSEFAERRPPPWMSFDAKWPLVECVVKDVAFTFPTEAEHRRCNSVLALITLEIRRVPTAWQLVEHSGRMHVEFHEPRVTRRSEMMERQWTFEVALRNCDVADFLVPLYLFSRAQRVEWRRGVIVEAVYKEVGPDGECVDVTWNGRIERLCTKDEEWPHSPWECLDVRWQSGNFSDLDGLNDATNSPAPVAAQDGSSRRNRSAAAAPSVVVAIAPPQPRACLALSNSETWSQCIGPWEAKPLLDPNSIAYRDLNTLPVYQMPRLSAAEVVRLSSAIERIMNEGEDRYEPFEFEVDSEQFPDYYAVVPVPIFIDLIRRRLNNGYYRQISSLVFDITAILNNCQRYNLPEAEIVQTAEELVQKLLYAVHSTSAAPEAAPRPLTSAMDAEVSMCSAESAIDCSNGGDRNGNSSRSSSSSNGTATVSVINESKDSAVERPAKRVRLSDNDGDASVSVPANSSENVESERLHLKIVLSRQANSRNSVRSEVLRGSRRQEARALSSSQELSPSSQTTLRIRAPSATNSSSASNAIAKDVEAVDAPDYQTHEGIDEPMELLTDTVQSQVDSGNEYEVEEDDESLADAGRKSRVTRGAGKANSSQQAGEDSKTASGRPQRSLRGRRRCISEDDSEYDENEQEEDDKDSDESEEGDQSDTHSELGRAPQTRRAQLPRSRVVGKKGAKRTARNAKQHHDDEDDDDDDGDGDSNSDGSEHGGGYNFRRKTGGAKVNNTRPRRSLPNSKNADRATRTSTGSRSSQPIAPVMSGRGRSTRGRPTISNGSHHSADQGQNSDDEESDDGLDCRTHATRASTQRSSSSIGGETLRRMTKLLALIEGEDNFEYFKEPVTDDVAPGYSEIIEHPMDLSTIRKKLMEGDYGSAKEMVADFELMFDNCVLYNEEASHVGEEAQRLRKLVRQSTRRL